MSAALRRLLALPLLLGVAVLLGLLAVACNDDDGGDEPDATPTPTPTAEEILDAAAARMQVADTFRFRLEHENGTTEIVRGLQMTEASGAVAGPERLSVDVKANAGPLNVNVSVIILPDESWITNPLTGRWEREDISVESLFDPVNGVPGLMRSVTGATITGRDEVDGVDTYVIEADVDSSEAAIFNQGGSASGRTLRARAWIGVEDPLVYRVELVGPITANENQDLVRRLNLDDFGGDIDIQAPR